MADERKREESTLVPGDKEDTKEVSRKRIKSTSDVVTVMGIPVAVLVIRNHEMDRTTILKIPRAAINAAQMERLRKRGGMCIWEQKKKTNGDSDSENENESEDEDSEYGCDPTGFFSHQLNFPKLVIFDSPTEFEIKGTEYFGMACTLETGGMAYVEDGEVMVFLEFYDEDC